MIYHCYYVHKTTEERTRQTTDENNGLVYFSSTLRGLLDRDVLLSFSPVEERENSLNVNNELNFSTTCLHCSLSKSNHLLDV